MKVGDKVLIVANGYRIKGTVTSIDDDGTITAVQWRDAPTSPYEYGIEQ